MGLSSKRDSGQLPGVISTLAAGFELTTSHLWLIVLPILLDVFFWLGPRLSIRRLVERYVDLVRDEPVLADLVQQMVQLGPQVNLFTSLSVPLIGIPALMSGRVPEKTPLAPPVLEVRGAFLWPLLVVCLSILGLVLTTFYFSLIGQALKAEDGAERLNAGQYARSVMVGSFRLLGLVVTFLFMLLLVWLPLLPLAFALGLLGGGLFLAVLMVGFVLVATYLSMSVPGIILHHRPLYSSILDSVRLVHRNALPTVNLLVLVVLIGSLMNLLWRMADDGSWITLVSIAGHGFVSTALAAAIFIFYRDRFTFLKSLDGRE